MYIVSFLAAYACLGKRLGTRLTHMWAPQGLERGLRKELDTSTLKNSNDIKHNGKHLTVASDPRKRAKNETNLQFSFCIPHFGHSVSSRILLQVLSLLKWCTRHEPHRLLGANQKNPHWQKPRDPEGESF